MRANEEVVREMTLSVRSMWLGFGPVHGHLFALLTEDKIQDTKKSEGPAKGLLRGCGVLRQMA